MKKLIKVLIVVSIITAVILLSDFFGVFKSSEPVTVNIPVGSNPVQISEMLKEHSLIRYPFFFSFYSVVKDARFQAGEHTFNKKSYSKLFKELSSVTSGESITVTITEGMEQREIADLLEKKGICSADEFNRAAKIKNFSNFWFLKNIPERESELEGYLFPDTYEFSKGSSAEDVILKMLNNFDSKITEKMKEAANKSELSFDELITLASIIEREAATEKDFKLVSGIFYNRMNHVGEGFGYFQSCATVQYILKERKDVLSIQDTKIDSPYNTYMYEGLPVGPIASPGIRTIEAALYPEKTEYLYFASDPSGKIYYAKTFTEHQENMRKAGL